MAFWSWSRTAGSNATADSTINWAEGQAPSSINDSARAMMARTAEWRDDIAGAIATGGSSTAYTVTSYQVFDTLAHMANQIIAFTPHTTSGATVTLNVDGLGSKPLRSAPNVELPAGTLIQGTPYLALYNNSDAVWYLHGFFGNPYNIPIASSIEYWGTTAPNSSFVFPYGQAISRTTYSALFALLSTTFGTGDGSTTFNIPDLRGRTTACMDNMGGSDASRLSGSSSMASGRNSIGGTGGSSSHTLTVAELPTGITSTGSNAITVTSQNGQLGIPTTTAAANISGSATGSGGAVGPASSSSSWGGVNSLSGTNTINVTSNNTSGSAHDIVQPTILCNRIMRII
jgi:microcystin-dependent protein